MGIGWKLPKSFYRIGKAAPSPEADYRHRVVAGWERCGSGACRRWKPAR